MLYSIFRNLSYRSVNSVNLNFIRRSSILNCTGLILNTRKSNELLDKSMVVQQYSFINLLPCSKHHYSTTMDNILELANLAEEQAASERSESPMDINEQFSESESGSSEKSLDSNIQIEKVSHKDNCYKHSFNIEKCYYKHIVGLNGSVLKKICHDTKTVIHISKRKKHVVITGSVQKKIIHARNKIEKLIENSKDKLSYTHFISIPTNSVDIRNKFKELKDDILKNCNIEETGFHEGFFQKPEKLHLTICMLHLVDHSHKQKAIEALNNCKENIIIPLLNESGPICIELKGLKCMNNNIAKAKILYINVEEKTGRLQKMSNAISEHFINQGLSRKERDNVTLHMTVVNTFYLKKKKQSKAKKNFNATSMLTDYKDVHLGKINLTTFHLSKLTAKSADGYFEAEAKIDV